VVEERRRRNWAKRIAILIMAYWVSIYLDSGLDESVRTLKFCGVY